MAALKRVAVFFDYQNTYEGARRAFFPVGAPWTDGSFNPLALANELVMASANDAALDQVRIYRGRPEATKQPGSYAANRRQCAAWEKSGCTVFTRTLRYPGNWPQEKAQEKGIDVQLAIDFVMLGLSGTYDVGILFSTDTDLKPALEAVVAAKGPKVEVAAWRAANQHNRRLSIQGRNLWCNWVDEAMFAAHQDTTDYTQSN